MQAADINKYIQQPHLLSQQSLPQLQQLVRDFPYFQSAHLLLSIAAKKWDASVYQQSLKKTAIVAGNRAHLFNLLHQPGPVEETVVAETKTVVETIAEEQPVVETKQTIVVPGNSVQPDAKEELNILKAAELATEQETAPVDTTTEVVEEKIAPAPEEVLEKEIEKAVVNSFVESEILKTPELHKPKAKEEPESFVEWLSLIKKNNGQPNQSLRVEPPRTLKPAAEAKQEPVADTEPQNKKDKQKAIIDRIIENNPGLIRSKEDQKFFNAETKAKESLRESEHLVTETLARIYALQGSVNKAVRAYEILSLKFPQKSAYFATLIQNLKNNS